MRRSYRHPRRLHTGLTLVEATMSMLIVSGLLLASLRAVGGVAKAQSADASTARGMCAATALISEILQQNYQESGTTNAPIGLDGTENGGHRELWDDVDDYDGFGQTGLTDMNKNPYLGFENWSSKVSVVWVDPTNVATVVASDSGLKRVTVTITDPNGKSTVLVALRSKYNLFDQNPTSTTTFVNQVVLSMQAGNDSSATSVTGILLSNKVPQQ